MTQTKGNVQRIAEFNALFMNLSEKGQEAALTVLRSLDFAQSVMFSQDAERQCKPKTKWEKGKKREQDSEKEVI